MSNLAHLPNVRTDHFLGPAEVCGDDTTHVVLKLSNGHQVRARIALGYGYRPANGDSVLTIGNDDGYYIIGVLLSQNETTLQFNGDVALHAAGKLHLRGEEGVTLDGPEVRVRAGKLEMLARQATQRFERLRQRVSDLLSVEAGQSHTVVEGAHYTRAKSATLLTEEKISINGKSIYLG